MLLLRHLWRERGTETYVMYSANVMTDNLKIGEQQAAECKLERSRFTLNPLISQILFRVNNGLITTTFA